MNLKKIYEGGNISVNGAEATSLKIKNMSEEDYGDFKEDFLAFLLSISDIFMEKTGYPIWNREDLIFNGEVFSGSTRAYFQKSREEFTNKKSKIGDFDVQVPENIFKQFHDFILNDLPNMEIGDFIIHGCSQTPGQDHSLVKANKYYPEVGADYIQVDWEYVPFKNNVPTEFSKFAHYSSWEDIENDVKGVFMKYLMRALVSTIDERENVIIVSQKTGKPLASANKSDIKHFMGFSVDKGVRTKYAPYIGEDGKIKTIDGKECWYEQPTKDSNYNQDLNSIYQLIFNKEPSESDKNDLYSFVRTLKNQIKNLDTQRIEKVFILFCKMIWKKGMAQAINPNNKEEDESIKTSAYNQFLKYVPELEKFDTEIQEMKEDYYSNF